MNSCMAEPLHAFHESEAPATGAEAVKQLEFIVAIVVVFVALAVKSSGAADAQPTIAAGFGCGGSGMFRGCSTSKASRPASAGKYATESFAVV